MLSGLVSRDPSAQKRKRNVGDGLLLLQQVGSENDVGNITNPAEVYHSISRGSRDQQHVHQNDESLSPTRLAALAVQTGRLNQSSTDDHLPFCNTGTDKRNRTNICSVTETTDRTNMYVDTERVRSPNPAGSSNRLPRADAQA